MDFNEYYDMIVTSKMSYPMPYESFSVVHKFLNLSQEDGISELEYCVEELAELIQAIQKLKRLRKRGKIDSELKTKQHLTEEMAHVYLTLNHVRAQENIDIIDIQEAIDKKIEEWGLKNE